MTEICISMNNIKPNFKTAAKALDKNKDGQVCRSENPDVSDVDFETFAKFAADQATVKANGKEYNRFYRPKLQIDAPTNFQKGELWPRFVCGAKDLAELFSENVREPLLRNLHDGESVRMTLRIGYKLAFHSAETKLSGSGTGARGEKITNELRSIITKTELALEKKRGKLAAKPAYKEYISIVIARSNGSLTGNMAPLPISAWPK